MFTILIGIGVSLFSELVTWLNKKFTGTVIAGDAAYLLVILFSIVAAVVKVVLVPKISASEWTQLGVLFGGIFATSQIFFTLFSKKVGLVVPEVSASTSSTI